MPRPNLPAHSARGHRHAGGVRRNDGPETCRACADKSAEIERLRSDLAQVNAALHGSGRRTAASPMMWAALSICGAGLLFAIFAILHHG
jgi:hypothetical protein